MFKAWPVVVTGLTFILFSMTALADGNDDLGRLINNTSNTSSITSATPVIQAADMAKMEDGVLRLTSNKNVFIRLEKDAASVVVNNPERAEIMLDSPRLLIVMPRQPGATSFTVLDSRGEMILEKDIIVTNVQPKYVRIRKMCVGSDATCVPASYYYCPDGCYEISPAKGESTTVPPPAGGAAASAANNAATLAPATPAQQQPLQTHPAEQGVDTSIPNNSIDEIPVGPDGEPAPVK